MKLQFCFKKEIFNYWNFLTDFCSFTLEMQHEFLAKCLSASSAPNHHNDEAGCWRFVNMMKWPYSDLYGDELAGYAELYHEIFLVVNIQLNLTKFPYFQMSTADDIHVDAKPNGHADGGDFRHHHRRRARRSSMASSSGTVTGGNSLYFSETDSDAVADGSLPVALTDEPLLMCNSSRGSPGTLVDPKSRQKLDCPVLPISEEEEVDLEHGESELNLQNNGDERGFRCRICHLNLEGNYDDSQGDENSTGVPVELGCSCKGDLGVAHVHCAETWFQIKGDPICEICGSIALNFMAELGNEVINIEVASHTSEAGSETHGCKHGHLVLTFMIAFMVLTFVISYTFHMKNLNRED